MKKVILCLALALSGFALELSEIQSTMQEKIDKSLKILQNAKADKKTAAAEIFTLFDGIFDYELMAKLSLSRHYEGLTNEQKKEFTQAFEASLKKSFTDKLELYKDQILKIKDAKQQNEKRYFLTSSMIVDGEEKFIVFKFYNEANNWLIYDVDILGISIIQTYRSQFGDILDNGDFKTLLEKLNTITIE